VGEAIVWWVTLQLLGIIAFPIGAFVLRSLPDRGYAVAKVLGLLLTVWLAYILAMLRVLQFGRALLLLCALVVAGFSVWLLLRNGRVFLREVQAHLRDRAFLKYVLAAELLFGVAYVAWALVRAYNPDIFGTEKFMDFGFMNAITKSQSFPPNDMWLAGYPINYYYFGYVLMASLSLLSGVPTQIGYNLAIVTLFSLTALGAFGVAYNLVVATVRKRTQTEVHTSKQDLRATDIGRGAQGSKGRTASKRAIPAEVAAPGVPTRRVKTSLSTANAKEAGSVAVSDAPPDVLEDGLLMGNGAGIETTASVVVAPGKTPKARHERSKPYDSPRLFVDSGRKGPRWLSPYMIGVLAALMVVGMGHLSTAFAEKKLDERSRMDGNGWRFCFLCQKPDFFTYWDPSRVIMDYKYVDQPGVGPQKMREQTDPINEFPAFSFILADMHPHVMALPLWMLALYFITALSRRRIARGSAWRDGLPHGLGAWLMLSLIGLVIGTLYTTNTWDYPTFLLLTLATLAVPYLAFQRRSDHPHGWRWILPWLVQSVLIIVLSLVVFLPFHLTFKSLVGSQPAEIPANLANIPVLGWVLQKLGSLLAVNTWDKGITGFLVIFGIFLVAIMGWLAYEVGRYFKLRASQGSVSREGAVLGGLWLIILLAAILLKFPLLALLLPMAVLSLYLVWREPELRDRNVILIMVALTSLIGLAVEIVYLRDVFNARQNTIFKFYYQIWVIWAVAAAYGVWRVLSAAFRRSDVPSNRSAYVNESTPVLAKAGAAVWAAAFSLLVVAGLLYLVYASAYKIGSPTPTLRGLDGLAHLTFSAPDDLMAINYLNQTATGNDVVLECCRDEYNNPGHAGRVSSYTGIPTLISWGGHEAQWRGGQPQLLEEAGKRRGIVTAIYTAQAPANTAQGLLQTLQQYSVDYVFVGATERGQGNAAGGDAGERVTPQAEALFKEALTEVFHSGTTVIYGVAKGEPGTSTAVIPTPTPLPQVDPNVPPVSMFTLGPAGVNRGQFNAPRGITRDAAGNFYVVDTGNLRIQKFDATGKWLAIFGNGRGDGDGQFKRYEDPTTGAEAAGTGPAGIAVDDSGNVYVADTWNHRIQTFDSTGKFVTKWGSFIYIGDAAAAQDPERDRKFYGPRGLAIGPGGDLYVTDTGNKRVLVFDQNGAFKRKIESGVAPGKTAPDYKFDLPGEMNEPMGIAVDSNGNVYVADRDNHRIQKFDNTGKAVAQWAVPDKGYENNGSYPEPFLAVDTAGNVYSTLPILQKIAKFSPTGQLLGDKDKEGATTLTKPTGLTLAPDGSIYIVDTEGNGVVKFGSLP
jgi:YYY domain-containing protein